jgi:VWFA-related protein
MRVISLVALAVLAASGPGPAQEPPVAAPPVFGVGVDVVAVDASVVDADGRPVLGLGPEDFSVKVDGRPRRLVSVEFVGRELEAPAPPPARPAHFSSNEGVEPGRLVLFLVDRGNIARASGRNVFASAARFIGTLPPADRVGLAVVPGPGPSIEFTPERDEVRKALRGLLGQGQSDHGAFRVPLDEAVAYLVYHDRFRWQEYTDLECAFQIDPQRVEQCRLELEGQAAQVLANYRERSLQSRRALVAVLRGLKAVEGSKTVVLISEGLWTETLAEVTEIGEAVAEAQVTLYVFLLEKPGPEAQFGRGHAPSQEERSAQTTALYDLAGMSRGAVFPVIGTSDAPFARLAREMTGHYLLGFEPEGKDRDGRSHSVKVEVSRPKTSVRARTLLSIPAAAPTPRDQLASALRSPRIDRTLAVRAATFAMRAADPGKVRLLIAAQVGSSRRPLSVGYALSGPGGKVVTSRAHEGVSGGEGEWGEFVGEVVVDPGSYLLRFAAVDAAGRRGSVEHTAKAALVSAGGLQVSDLVLGAERAGAALRPSVDLELEGGGLQALVEVGGGDTARLAGAAVAFELADSADGPALLRAPVSASAPGADGVRVAKVTLAGGLLPPGQYSGRAEVSVGGKAVAVVTRPFRVLPPREGEGPRRAPLASLLVETRPFDRRDLLEPDTLLHFVDRVTALVPGPVPGEVAAAIEEARQGRPEAMLDRLGGASKPDARAAFLRGVSYYARGNLAAALTQLQEALRLSSELLPAAVYMGACHAASGRDLDAIGAWQTALIGDTGSPVLFGLLGDALLRVKEAEQAVGILSEGLAAFPGDAALRRRLALAHAMAGRGEEALPLLTAWVDEHPDDTQALQATLALLFEGFSRQAGGAAPEAERQRLLRYAAAYVEGGGPNREIVGRWLEYLRARAGS